MFYKIVFKQKVLLVVASFVLFLCFTEVFDALVQQFEPLAIADGIIKIACGI